MPKQPTVPPPGPPEKIPRPGRQPNDATELAKMIQAGSDYYLRNATQFLIHTAAHEVPVECLEECPYERACALQESERPRTVEHPLYGKRCPIEAAAIYTCFYGYMAELGIDEMHPTEIQTAVDLATIQVWKRRIHVRIMEDSDGELLMDKVLPGGGLERVVHPLFATKKDLEAREEKILKQFMATRSELMKAKAAERNREKKSGAEWLAGLEDDIIDVEAR